MKSALIIKLIEAHSGGNEDVFKKALQNLVSDEERKGNIALASSLLAAYSAGSKPATLLTASPLTDMSFSVQSTIPMPKDKDSALELLEIMQPKIKLSDVALQDKTREVLTQIVGEQKNATKLLEKGITPTNRILFCGPPGCGKTMTANALAGEIDIPVAYVKLDGLVSSYLGQTGANIRKIFDYVKDKRIMLFLDEFDAIAKKRDDAHELGELKRVVTTLLQNMDNMPANVFLVAATNHHHLLDPAIWRRFNNSILLELPNEYQRNVIVSKCLSNVLSDYTVDVSTIVKLTEGMSGAQVTNFIQILAKHCIMQNADKALNIKDIASVWLKQSTLLISDDDDAYTKALLSLKNKGVSLRTLEELTGIKKSTLSYRFKKEEDAYE